MPIKRRYRKRRFPRRPRKTMALKRYRFPRRNLNAMGIHYFKRTVSTALDAGFGISGNLNTVGSRIDFVTPAASAGTTVFGNMGYYFSIQSLPNISEFTSLFDSYQIRKVVIKIAPYNTISEAGATVGQYGDLNVMLHYAIDHDSATAPSANESGIQTLQQYVGYKRVSLTGSNRRPVTIVVKPRAATAFYKGAFSAYGEAAKRTWFDCNNTDTQFYGLLGVFEGIPPNANVTNYPMRIETTYYLKFKGPR